jgi:hypothetical protein
MTDASCFRDRVIEAAAEYADGANSITGPVSCLDGMLAFLEGAAAEQVAVHGGIPLGNLSVSDLVALLSYGGEDTECATQI